jgi:hypothetical protein
MSPRPVGKAKTRPSATTRHAVVESGGVATARGYERTAEPFFVRVTPFVIFVCD